ncbi:MAG TPA: MlaD family protein, partial [Solirubrobacteraceae bacterium]|nr:MlaD family protein [Solirubrobacteraceae bacterium]
MSRARWWRRHDELPVVELQRSKPLRFAIALAVIVALTTYFGFTKHVPFKHGFRLKAQFATAMNIHPKSPVRIAGVDVGKVSSIERDGKAGLVTMEIESRGLPIHADATLKIRPRIFLEGNWFVELRPGSPSAPTVSSGDTIPITQTAQPVQLDQVLDALDTDTRANLQKFLVNVGEALSGKPNAAEDAEQDPEVRGLNAAQALNKLYVRAPSAERGAAVINQALGGTSTHDLSKLLASVGKVTTALNVHEQQLGELLENFNTFFGTLAGESTGLTTTVRELPKTLHGINHGLASLQASLAPTRTFAHDILPGLRNTPATVTAALPWIEQVRASLAPSELGGVARGLAAATPSLGKLIGEQTPFYRQGDLFNKCLTNVFFPAINTKLQDGASTSGVESYKEFWYSLVGVNGVGAGFNGAGAAAKFIVGNGGQTLRSQPVR